MRFGTRYVLGPAKDRFKLSMTLLLIMRLGSGTKIQTPRKAKEELRRKYACSARMHLIDFIEQKAIIQLKVKV